MGVSRYAGIPRSGKNAGNEYFRGTWHGKEVSFPRVFRGHRFSDEECLALCRGEDIEVHGLVQGGVPYSVHGCLREDRFGGVSRSFETVAFRSEGTVSPNPDYDFSARTVRWADGAGPVDPDSFDAPPEDLEEIPPVAEEDMPYADPDLYEDEKDRSENGNRMEAEIRSMEYPTVINIAPKGRIPVFIPVFELLDDPGVREAVERLAVAS